MIIWHEITRSMKESEILSLRPCSFDKNFKTSDELILLTDSGKICIGFALYRIKEKIFSFNSAFAHGEKFTHWSETNKPEQKTRSRKKSQRA